MLDWIEEHRTILFWLTVASVVVFVASLIIVPAVVVRIPDDYFLHRKRAPGPWARRHPALRITLRIAKNALGVVLIVVGIAMLVLPGQGLLTVLIGVLLLDFPGKYRVEKWVISRGRILRSINWLRKRSGRPPIRVVDSQ